MTPLMKLLVVFIITVGGGVLGGALLILHANSQQDLETCMRTMERCPHGILITDTNYMGVQP